MEKTQIQVIRKNDKNSYWKKEGIEPAKRIHSFEYWKLYDKSFHSEGKNIEVLPPIAQEKVEIFKGEKWDITIKG